MTHASGENFTIEIEDGVAVCRLFRRADVDPARLADAHAALGREARALSLKDGIEGLVLDVRRVPGAVGPQVEAVYAEIARAWEATGQHIAFLVLDDDPIQKMQVLRVATQAAPRFGAVFSDRNDARAYVGARATSDRNTVSKVLDRPSRVHRR